jgi:hypothetical protein
MEEERIFETSNADLATYLVFEGIRLLECKVKNGRKKVVIMRFLDEFGKCLDLERVYLNTEFKKFRDINKWLLAKIHTTLREE